METISDYTIYCTEEQTKKALELGAPIENYNYTFGNKETCTYLGKDYTKLPALDWFAQQPTAEQMRGWLEGQGIYIIVPIPLIKDFNKKDFSKADAFGYRVVINGSEVYSGEYLSTKEATIAAIDEALEYLENNRK